MLAFAGAARVDSCLILWRGAIKAEANNAPKRYNQLMRGDQLGSVASVGVMVCRSLKPAMSIEEIRAE